MDKLIELLIKFGGLIFENPLLIPLLIIALTVYLAYRRYQYLWDHGERGFPLCVQCSLHPQS
jgi:hypothetical protein